jgi:hypothetical protein
MTSAALCWQVAPLRRAAGGRALRRLHAQLAAQPAQALPTLLARGGAFEEDTGPVPKGGAPRCAALRLARPPPPLMRHGMRSGGAALPCDAPPMPASLRAGGRGPAAGRVELRGLADASEPGRRGGRGEQSAVEEARWRARAPLAHAAQQQLVEQGAQPLPQPQHEQEQLRLVEQDCQPLAKPQRSHAHERVERPAASARSVEALVPSV